MKYKFTGETKVVGGVTLNRIQRISDGLIGGWIEKEENLSQDGYCFVYGEARVFGEAQVFGEARVCGEARVFGEAQVSGWSRVCDRAQVSGWALVFGWARVFGEARVYGKSWVFGEAQVFGEARVCGEVLVSGWARVFGEARVPSPSDLIHICMHPYNVTITPQNIVIGCQMRSRFGKEQWKKGGPSYTEELGKIYNPILKTLKNTIKRAKK